MCESGPGPDLRTCDLIRSATSAHVRLVLLKELQMKGTHYKLLN